MKRFKASIIGGSGYGAAEIIRRLLIHPDVELVRVASIDYVGELLSAAHPNLEGLTQLRFEKISPEEAAAGMDVVFLGLPHKVSAGTVPRILGTGAANHRPVRRLPAQGRRGLRELLRRRPPRSAPARASRVRAARGAPRGHRGRAAHRLARLLRDGDHARPPAAGAGRAARGRGRDGGHHRLERERRRALGGHAPPGARDEPADLQTARAPAPARDPADAHGSRERPGSTSTSCR